MPCEDGGGWAPGESPSERLDQVTRMLCSILASGRLVWTTELEKWWKEHQKKDAARQAGEAVKQRRIQLREQAIAKLTPEEQSALNLPKAKPKPKTDDTEVSAATRREMDRRGVKYNPVTGIPMFMNPI